ncbi:MAG TPA: SDR family NAD(P)-dependent oxidoreductase [Acidimicrobiales bacterium]|nr:SDR family NAD(P)-dependent oxidoreductase [Acidimicrobiales bacterium]
MAWGEASLNAPAPGVAVITGAASDIGIGRAAAIVFASQGWRLGILDVDEAGLQATADLCSVAGGNVVAIRVDVASTTDVRAAVENVRAALGPIDAVVANAGIARRKPFLELRDRDFEEVLGVNLGGVWRLAQAALPDMITRRRGRIVAVSSLMGSPWGWAEHAHYSASKAAVEGLVRALAVELGPLGVTVNAVSPGFIRTNQSLDVVNSGGEEGMRKSVGYVPLRRIGEANDIAGVIAFLCSDAAGYMNGQALLVDGGLTLGDLSQAAVWPAAGSKATI